MRLALVPKTTEFYVLFTRAGQNMLETARLAERRFREHPQPSVAQKDVKELENRGDDLTREIIDLLNTQYITPFDREDIYDLAKAIDDVVDYIENASDLLGLYKVGSRMEQSVEMQGARQRYRAPGKSAVRAKAVPAGRAAHRRRQGARGRRRPDRARSDRGAFRGKGGSGGDHPLEGHLRGARGCDRLLRTAADLVGNIVVKNV